MLLENAKRQRGEWDDLTMKFSFNLIYGFSLNKFKIFSQI